ncbi:DEAD/DEAH box helicase, partial [Pseudogracilibacillus auburnensis]|uniref:DEAD/DEAH box helicase n=1 Tax=Pseudogracilibacillus auburnensis TaxID=1494959 RepID=UPI001A95C58E
ENLYLKQLLTKMMHIERVEMPIHILTNRSSSEEKIRLFQSVFLGRGDVFALRFQDADGKKGYRPVYKSFGYEVLEKHLIGEHTVGIYPLLKDHTCHFLAVDFDKGKWKEDVSAFAKICKLYRVPYQIERSRSGNGAHVWVFFDKSISAAMARKLGMVLLNKTKEKNHQFTLKSFDRLFPSQDILSGKGLGNLIALPLQREPRKYGNSVFVNEQFVPYPDQWMFLSTISKMTENEVRAVIAEGNQQVVYEENVEIIPEKIVLTLKNGIYIEKNKLPQSLLSKITEIASFSNPEYYKAKANRFSTYNIPKVIQCSEDKNGYLILPRGCMGELIKLLKEQAIDIELKDERYDGMEIAVDFSGTLSTQQHDVAQVMMGKDYGILSATTGFGKTVLATSMIAERGVNTLIIVNRTHLLEQWIEQMSIFLNFPKKDIGQIGGGKNKITGKIDVATIQSLNYGGDVKSFITQYGQVIVDECHHISALTFEKVLKKIRPKYVLGLTATPKRKDGLDPIISMQCGPIRYKMDAKTQAKIRPFRHRLVARKTLFASEKTEFNDIYAEVFNDSKRNQQIFNDVLHCLEEKRSPIILTERLEHLTMMEEQFKGFAKNIIILSGNMKKRERNHELERLLAVPDSEERLIIATGKYIGEGFDDPRLDTLFLTMPISWKGTLQQYVGRLHRNYDGKEEVRVYDYVDHEVPVFKRMFDQRLKGYQSMGYAIKGKNSQPEQMQLF